MQLAAIKIESDVRIFLSHASEQHALADRLAVTLRARGDHVFLDRDELPPAREFHDRIRKAIDRCDLFCFLISPQSVAVGRFTLNELSAARRRWPNPVGHVLPIMVEKIPRDSVPAYLGAITILEPEGDVVAEVLSHIEELRPNWFRHWRRGAAALMILVIIGGFAGYKIGLFYPPPLKGFPSTDTSGTHEPLSTPLPPPPSGTVDGINIEVIATQRSVDRDMILVELEYRVMTGPEGFRHDPIRFVRLVSDGVQFEAMSAPRPLDLLPKSQHRVRVGFRLRAGAVSSIVFRFGQDDFIDLPPRWVN